MEYVNDPVLHSRLRFAPTAMFPILRPVPTIGLPLFPVAFEALWLRSRAAGYFHRARFRSRLLPLIFALAVVSGLPLEFGFGSNRAPFSSLGGDFFGNVPGFEGAMAFMLEAGFIGILLPGRERLPRALHFFVTGMVAVERDDGHAPFVRGLVIFLASFVGLAASLYPYLIPTRPTLDDAAASSPALVFMPVGIGMLIPVTPVYHSHRYRVFRGGVPRGPRVAVRCAESPGEAAQPPFNYRSHADSSRWPLG